MSEPGDARAAGTGRPVTAMTMRTYRVGPDGQRTGYTPTIVVPSAPESALSALNAAWYVPCACPRCKPRRAES